MEQVFALKMIGEKLLEKDKVKYVCFINLGKAYYRLSRRKLFEVLR